MRRNHLFILAGCLMLSFSVPASAASEETETVETAAEETAEEEAVEEEAAAEESEKAGALSDDPYSFQMMYQDEIYEFPMTYEAFISKGWVNKDDEDMEISPNSYTWGYFEKDGVKVNVDILNVFMNTLPASSCDVVGFSVDSYSMGDGQDISIVLPAGITYGVSTLDDITDAWGKASDVYEGSLYTKLTYEYDFYQRIELEVDLESGVLSAIDICNMDTDKCSTASMEAEVSDEIPANVTNYKAPEALSDDLMDFTIDYAGDLYQLPCPVSVFLENGWTKKNGSEEVVAGKGSGWVYLMKENQELRIIARNYEENATAIENCFVTEVKTDVYGPDLPMTIAKGITRGMTASELEAALDGIEYETSDSGNFVYYTVKAFDSYVDGYEFIVNTEEDCLIGIEVEYQPKTLG